MPSTNGKIFSAHCDQVGQNENSLEGNSVNLTWEWLRKGFSLCRLASA